MTTRDTQFICQEPKCECVDGDSDECACSVVPSERRCANCNAPMIEIDINPGEPIAPVVDPRQGALFE